MSLIKQVESSPVLAAFDLDGTLLNCNSSFAFCRFLHENGELKTWQMAYCGLCYINHLYFNLSLEKLHTLVFKRLFQGKKVNLLEDLAKKFIHEKIASFWFEPALHYLKALREKGAFVVILSNSPSFLVKLIAAKIGVDEVVGTSYEVDLEGHLKAVGEVMDGEKKRLLLKKYASTCDSFNTYAFSDSFHDLPFLEASSHPVVVSPKSKFKKFALSRGWEIL